MILDSGLGESGNSCRLKIVRRVEVGKKARLFWLPVELRPRPGARSRSVHGKELPDPPKMLSHLFPRLRDHRHVQSAADDFSDLSGRHALVGDAVIARSGRAFLKREPIETCRVQSMHTGPTVEPVANVCRNT